MTILVTGSSGFVGTKLLERFPCDEIVGLGRKKPLNLELHQFIEAEIDRYTDYSAALSGVSVVIHLAARVHVMGDSVENPLDAYREINTLGTINLARQAVNAGVKRFVFISSIKVNGESSTSGYPFTYTDKRKPEDFYGQSKSEAEEQLLALAEETGLEVVIIRPTLVYGAGVKANFASLMNSVSKGFPLPFGSINSNKRSLVSVVNLVDLIVTCIEHPKAKNQVFLVSDDHDVSTSEMVRQMSVACGKTNFQLPIPAWCYKLAGKLFKKEDVVARLIGSLQVDISYTKEKLDWTPPQSLQDGFKETADYILNKRGNK
ncbi:MULTISPECIES: SDR family oxidoreductase [unclassified Vibrio]|uniref:UDP-glucose 4-epimerase family protein n=1 Tax=unclassified Vibrio TaxID=2614977 RepID=UPI00159DFB79|nr:MULTISPECIES: SDR family oxidoreductase [unclassified Vibrio]NVN82681.1 SDR family oxidoreductase [Vibrio sp. Scap16]QLE93214.1 SDR family oxidoreductase [Vibrio sp. Scap24]